MTKFLPNVAVVSVRLLLISGLIVMMVAAFSAGLRFEIMGGRLLAVQTASMQPVFRPGDAIIAWHVSPNKLRLGDIVCYHSQLDPAVLISHRIVAISPDHSKLTTRGDDLSVVDPAIASSAVIGRVSAVAPKLGSFLSWLRSPLGLGLILYLPSLSLVSLQARRVVQILKPIGYQLYDR